MIGIILIIAWAILVAGLIRFFTFVSEGDKQIRRMTIRKGKQWKKTT